MLPAVMLRQREMDLHEWPPLRTFWLPNKVHTGFLWGVVCLAGVTLDARTHNVLPGRRTATVPRHNVIQGQILAVADFAAILAGIFVPFGNVRPSELQFPLWHID